MAQVYGNDFARNVVIFGVDNTLLFHTDNRINSFLALHEGPTDNINDSVGTTE